MYVLKFLKNMPLKKKYIRANQTNFMDSKLNAICCAQSHGINFYIVDLLKDREAYEKQRIRRKSAASE